MKQEAAVMELKQASRPIRFVGGIGQATPHHDGAHHNGNGFLPCLGQWI